MRDPEEARDRALLAEIAKNSWGDRLRARLHDYARARLDHIESPAQLRYLLRVMSTRWEFPSATHGDLTASALRRLEPLWIAPPSLSDICRWFAEPWANRRDLEYLPRKTRAQRLVHRVIRERLCGKDQRKVLLIAIHGVSAELSRGLPRARRRRVRADIYREALRELHEELARRVLEAPTQQRAQPPRFVDWLLEVELVTLTPDATRDELVRALESIFRRPRRERGAALAAHLLGDPEVLEARTDEELLDAAFEAWG